MLFTIINNILKKNEPYNPELCAHVNPPPGHRTVSVFLLNNIIKVPIVKLKKVSNRAGLRVVNTTDIPPLFWYN